METKRFDLPTHPSGKKQAIVVEKPASESVWYLVVDKGASIPLVNLKDPKNPKQVLDALKSQNGEAALAQFCMGGYSKGDE